MTHSEQTENYKKIKKRFVVCYMILGGIFACIGVVGAYMGCREDKKACQEHRPYTQKITSHTNPDAKQKKKIEHVR